MDFEEFCTKYEGGDFGVSGSRRVGQAGDVRTQAFEFAIENLHEHGGHRLHHGAAVGIDSLAHWRAYRLKDSGMTVTLHPPIKKRWAAVINHSGKFGNEGLLLWPGCEVLPDRAYGARDYDIVKASRVLVAVPEFPYDDYRSRHSGTWLTVSFAWREGVPVFCIAEDGSITDITNYMKGLT